MAIETAEPITNQNHIAEAELKFEKYREFRASFDLEDAVENCHREFYEILNRGDNKNELRSLLGLPVLLEK